uniref:Uncharacterized protein n=1 Tax=Knipowitschia caucasica TaxID=637954 RepID=A0AAV2M0A6_KNICA
MPVYGNKADSTTVLHLDQYEEAVGFLLKLPKWQLEGYHLWYRVRTCKHQEDAPQSDLHAAAGLIPRLRKLPFHGPAAAAYALGISAVKPP